MDIVDIRKRFIEGCFEFSLHAFHRLIERNITEAEIREAGSNAEIIENYPEDKYLPSCLILGFLKSDRPLHLQVCYTDSTMLKVITLYEPDAKRWNNLRERVQR